MGNAVVRVNGHAYENQCVLAEGGFATVFRLETLSQRNFRVRRGDAQFALKWTRGIGDNEQLQRVLLEIQVQRKLQHPNAMRLIEAEVRVSESRGAFSNKISSPGKGTQFPSPHSEPQPPKEALLVFPLYPRGTLQQHLDHCFQQQTPAFTEQDCLRIFTLLAEAVLELQARGYAHRDIKPHNVLLTSSDPVEPVLTDFGSICPVTICISSSHDAFALFEDAAQFCSAAYRAPELWEANATTRVRGTVDNARADVWSLGCVVHALAFGPLSPFESATQGVQQLAIFSGNVRFPPENRRFGQCYSAAFVCLIQWMLCVDPLDRPTIYQVLDRVDELSTGRSRSSSRRLSTFSLQRSVSTAQQQQQHRAPSTVPSTPASDDGWADFSAFNNDDTSTSPQPSSDVALSSQASSSSASASSLASWHVVPRKTLLTVSSMRPSIQSTRSLSGKGDGTATTMQVDQRRKLSLRGRQLLATALSSSYR